MNARVAMAVAVAAALFSAGFAAGRRGPAPLPTEQTVPAARPARPQSHPAARPLAAAYPVPQSATAELEAERDHLAAALRVAEAEVAEAYVVGGAAKPFDPPPSLDAAYRRDAVEAWTDRLAERCPTDADVVMDVDCGEFPCIVAIGWTTDDPVRSVVCELPDLAGGQWSNRAVSIDDGFLNSALLPVGPRDWPPDADVERWRRRSQLRNEALESILLERIGASPP
jgi:hypothetical protein